MKKVEFPINKHQWHPNLIPGAIVLISTYNAQGEPNIAPKSLIQMVSIDPAILMFAGTPHNTTETNILTTKCFGVNIVDASMAPMVYDCIYWFGQDRITKSGFTVTHAATINAPIVEQCKAHLECRLHQSMQIGHAFVIFGEIVHASIWSKLLPGAVANRYQALDQIVYLENGVFASITNISTVEFSKKEYLKQLKRYQPHTNESQ